MVERVRGVASEAVGGVGRSMASEAMVGMCAEGGNIRGYVRGVCEEGRGIRSCGNGVWDGVWQSEAVGEGM